MKCTVDNEEYRISWAHSKLEPSVGLGQAITVCYMHTTSLSIDASGYALCSVKDKYDKNVGRKVSLARALQSAGLDKDVRTQIWHRYHHRDMHDGQYREAFA